MRFIGSIFIIGALGIIGFVVTIFASLSRDAEFYVPFFIALTIGVMVMIILAIYGYLSRKVPRVIVGVIIGLLIGSVVTFEGYQAYEESLEIVSTQDVDLSEYQPFKENTKAVKLDEESTFKITKSNLPKLDGATALYPVYAAFAQAVYPEKEYNQDNSEVVSRQTSGAFHSLFYGHSDIIFTAHPSENQMERAKSMGFELELTPIGREAFVFFVHSDNPVEELTIEEIQGIYSGEITNWKEVGGKNQKIRAYQRPEDSGSQSALQNLMGDIPLMVPPSEDIVTGMGGIIRETTNYRNKTNAIGFSFRHFSQDMVDLGKIKNIEVEGVLPTKENIKNGSYPIIGEFYAITAGNKNSNIEPFIDWMISEQGQKIVELSGYVPVN
ncbi:hypothetical protein GCM10008967_38370 [Bacillus carboniphilus]|uniref:PBP domain-containing protein n=1 Tax=Bacillus carboniphilus TaxID=86663 RepID=A0ABP3GFG9_9BACI